MPDKKPLGLFIVGTNTEVGKTYVTALIARQLVAQGKKVGVYKPVASDCYDDGSEVISEDAMALWQAAGQPLTWQEVCPQRFRAPLAPYLAAKEEGKELDPQLMRDGLKSWTDGFDIILVEGAGGLMSPLTEQEYVADLAADFGFPLILVAPNVLGTINQTLQTLITASAFDEGLHVGGVVLNHFQYLDDDPSVNSNWNEIAKRTPTPLLVEVSYLSESLERDIDWMSIAEGNIVSSWNRS